VDLVHAESDFERQIPARQVNVLLCGLKAAMPGKPGDLM
jgi:hypothetical protein